MEFTDEFITILFRGCLENFGHACVHKYFWLPQPQPPRYMM